MSLRLDPSSAVPVFRQIVDGLRAAIAAGVYRPGERVPSVRQQAVALVVNPNTVQRAYEELERQGLLESRRGVGMVVSEGSRPAAARSAADALAATFVDAVARARAAGLTRAKTDALYRRAWAAGRTPDSKTSEPDVPDPETPEEVSR